MSKPINNEERQDLKDWVKTLSEEEVIQLLLDLNEAGQIVRDLTQ